MNQTPADNVTAGSLKAGKVIRELIENCFTPHTTIVTSHSTPKKIFFGQVEGNRGSKIFHKASGDEIQIITCLVEVIIILKNYVLRDVWWFGPTLSNTGNPSWKTSQEAQTEVLTVWQNDSDLYKLSFINYRNYNYEPFQQS